MGHTSSTIKSNANPLLQKPEDIPYELVTRYKNQSMTLLIEKFGLDITTIIVQYLQCNPTWLLHEKFMIGYQLSSYNVELFFNRTKDIQRMNNETKPCQAPFDCIIEISGAICTATISVLQIPKSKMKHVFTDMGTTNLKQSISRHISTADKEKNIALADDTWTDCILIKIKDKQSALCMDEFTVQQSSLRAFNETKSYGHRFYKTGSKYCNIYFRLISS